MEVIMILEKGFLYHVYNRGNNSEKLFYNHANYRFFLQKLIHHVLPYADIIAWCLIPNHFHLMIYVRRETILNMTLNQSIGKMLSSYARAINIQEGRTGSLFQQHTKSICLNGNITIRRSWHKHFGVTKIESWNEKQDYPKICLRYIHQNPVNAGIVINVEEWKWSSYNEIQGIVSNHGLVNMERLKTVVSL